MRTSRVPIALLVSDGVDWMEDGLGWGCGLGFCGDDEEEGPTIARFLKAMPWVTMGCVDRDFMPQILEAHRCIDDQALCAADAKVGMEEDDVFLFEFRHEGLVRGIGLKGTLCGRVWLSTVAWGCVLVLSLDNPRDDLSQRWRNSTEVGACAWPRRLVEPAHTRPSIIDTETGWLALLR
jgi:hypothetical protein